MPGTFGFVPIGGIGRVAGMNLLRGAILLGVCAALAGGGCRPRALPAPFPAAAAPGETVFFVPVRAPLLALTFDDGPSEPATGLILDALRARGVPASFFLIGSNAERCPALARRIAAEGHLVGNHTHRHRRFDQSDAAAVARDIRDGQSVLTDAAGVTPRWFRPPYGINGPGMEDTCRDLGLAIAGWSADANDWNPHPVADLVRSVVDSATAGDIILLHDGWDLRPDADRQRTAAAVPLILDGLAARGFRFVTLPDLLRAAGPPLAEFANGVRLLGMQTPRTPLAPGAWFAARYFWDVPPGQGGTAALRAFVHFTTPDGRRHVQDDHSLPAPGDVRDRLQRHLLRVPPKAPPGVYQVRAGLFDPARPEPAARVPVRSALRQTRGAVILPGALEVTELGRQPAVPKPNLPPRLSGIE